MAADKTLFAPFPVRAISDQRLAGLHLRVLAQIAWHDRLSTSRSGRPGAGCYASFQNMAQAVGCHHTRFSSAVTDLGRWGYLTKEQHPLNKSLRVLRVIYAPENSLPDGKVQSLPDGKEPVCQTTEADPETVCHDFSQADENTQGSSVNIFRETGNTFRRNGETNSSEEASIRKFDQVSPDLSQPDAANLRRLEHWLSANPERLPKDQDGWIEYLELIVAGLDGSDPIKGWSDRLNEELCARS